MPDVDVIENPAIAAVALDPRRARLLAALADEPASAAAVAARLGLPRQQVGHHLRALEEHGLIVEVGHRQHGGLTERVFAPSAQAYVVSPSALGPVGIDPARVPDSLSAAYLVALAARAVREVGGLLRGASRAGKQLPTLSVDADVRFATAAHRTAFTADLAEAVRGLAARYHDDTAPDGRTYRVIVLSHPALRRSPTMDERPAEDRVIDLSVDVPGSPEEVWRAIATGPGISSWFVPHELEEREGAGVRMDFGAGLGEESAVVSAWEPPHRVVFQAVGERALAYEWLVEARAGGGCVVRLVNSGFGPGADWDADYHGMSEGWPLFLENLRLHLAHFSGQSARAVIPVCMLHGTRDSAFAQLCAALGVRTDLAAGDVLIASAPGAPPLAGQVASTHSSAATRAYFLRLDAPAPGTAFLAAEGGGDQVGVSLWLYLYGPEAADLPDEWSPFLAALGEQAAATA